MLPANRLGNLQEYYFSTKLDEIRRMNATGADVLNLGIGSPDLPPSTMVRTVLSTEASRDDTHSYQSYKGVPELRDAIANYYDRIYHVKLDVDGEVLPLLGSKEGVAHISMAFLNPGDKALIPDPGYPTYSAATQLAGASPLMYSLDANNAWGIDWDQLNNMDLNGVKIMWVNYPNMPTGAKGSMQLFEEVVAFGREHQILICHDNPYSRILNDTPLSILAVDGARDVALELNSLSKSHNMAGWRLGWVSGSKEHIATVLRYKSNIDSGMFLPVQRGGIAALREGEDWFEQLNSEYRNRKVMVCQMLDELGCTYNLNQAGLFVWAEVGTGKGSAESFCDTILHEARVFLAPGTVFGKNGEGYVRVSLCNPMTVLSEAAKRIGEYARISKV